jgi:hypothetical protein
MVGCGFGGPYNVTLGLQNLFQVFPIVFSRWHYVPGPLPRFIIQISAVIRPRE